MGDVFVGLADLGRKGGISAISIELRRGELGRGVVEARSSSFVVGGVESIRFPLDLEGELGIEGVNELSDEG